MTAAIGPTTLVRIAGRDAVAFAHAQFTSDVQSLAESAWQWSAWLDAQGRARAVFALLRTGSDELHAWQPLGDGAALRDALARYVLRAALRIDTVEATAFVADAVAAPAAGRWHADDGWTFALGDGRAVRLALGAPVASDPVALDDWRRRDVEARLPLLPSVLAGEFTPQALGLEAIDAIRFDKGCYPGQEVAARLHFRGGNKRRLVAASTDAAAACGDDLLDDRGGLAGRVLYPAAGAQRLLAVVVEDAPSALRTRAGETVRLD